MPKRKASTAAPIAATTVATATATTTIATATAAKQNPNPRPNPTSKSDSLPKSKTDTNTNTNPNQPAPNQPLPQKQNRKSKKLPKSKSETRTLSFTFRHPPYIYFHLSLLPPLSLSTNPSNASFTQPSGLAPVDALTARQHLTAALSQFLGLTGSAIAGNIDVLKVGADHAMPLPEDVEEEEEEEEERPAPNARNRANGEEEREVWIRVPREDAEGVAAALASWSGEGKSGLRWRVWARGTWLGGLKSKHKEERGLFEFSG